MSTRPVVADMLADAQQFLDGGVDELSALLDEFASYGDQPVPAPSPELALLLAGRPAASAPRPQRPAVPVRLRTRRTIAGLAAAAVSGLSLTGAAAVANELPAPIQRAVAHFSEQYLPFSFPRPVGDPPLPGGSAGTEPGQDGAGTGSTQGREETSTVNTGQGVHGGESRGRTAPVTGPSRTSGSPTGRTGKTGPAGAAGATGPATDRGHAGTSPDTHPDVVGGGEDEPVEPESELAPEPAPEKLTSPPKGHAHTGPGNTGNTGKGSKATPQRPAHPPKGGGSAPADRGAGGGSGADGTAPDATKAPHHARGATGASAASSGAHAAKSDAPKVRAREATTEDGSGVDSS